MLVFLHGFLGQKEDWNLLFSHLSPTISKRAIDLPGHGEVPFTPDIAEKVHEQIGPTKILVGYSAGGRLALELKTRYPNDFEKVIAISAHTGLQTEQERAKRWQIDQKWIHMLQTEPFDRFLDAWYQQPLFDSLAKYPSFSAMLQRRKKADSKALAQFLEVFSPAKKTPPEIFPGTFFLFGEEDLKYEKLYHTLPSFGIPNAGHAVHLEAPKVCAKVIEGIIDDIANTAQNHMA